jgi:hypothetical protein
MRSLEKWSVESAIINVHKEPVYHQSFGHFPLCFTGHLTKFQSRYTRIFHWRNASCQPVATTLGHPLVLLLRHLHHHEKRDTYFSCHCTRTAQTEWRAEKWSFCIPWHKVLLCYCVPRVMVQWERQGPNEVEASCIIVGYIYFIKDWQFKFWHNQCQLHEMRDELW